MQPLFMPPFPHRSRDWAPVWTSFVGQRASNSVYGWPEEAFDVAWRTQRVLGYTVHLGTVRPTRQPLAARDES